MMIKEIILLLSILYLIAIGIVHIFKEYITLTETKLLYIILLAPLIIVSMLLFFIYKRKK